MDNINEVLSKIKSLDEERKELLVKSDEIRAKLGKATSLEEDNTNLLELRNNEERYNTIYNEQIELYRNKNRIIAEVDNINHQIKDKEESLKGFDAKIANFNAYPETVTVLQEIKNEELAKIEELKVKKDKYFGITHEEKQQNTNSPITTNEEIEAKADELLAKLDAFDSKKKIVSEPIKEQKPNDISVPEIKDDFTKDFSSIVGGPLIEPLPQETEKKEEEIEEKEKEETKANELAKKAATSEPKKPVKNTKPATSQQKVNTKKSFKEKSRLVKLIGTGIVGLSLLSVAGIALSALIGGTAIPLTAIGAGVYVASKAGMIKK